MPATGQNITHYAGDSATITIPVRSAAGANVDLTGAKASWWMGKAATSTGTDVYIKKSSEDTLVDEEGDTVPQIDIVGSIGDGWSLLVKLIPEDTEDTETTSTSIKPGTYYHEAEVIDASGHVSTVTIGKYVLKPTMVRNS